MSKTDYAENKTLDWCTGKGDPPTSAGARWLALFTAAPSDAGGGTEVTGSGYVRKALTTADFATAASGATSNAQAITFAAFTGAVGPVTHWAIMDAATGGNMIRWAAATTSKSYANGDIATFPIGSLALSED